MGVFTPNQKPAQGLAANELHQQSIEELTEENTRWLKVMATILGDMKNVCPNDIYEDLE